MHHSHLKNYGPFNAAGIYNANKTRTQEEEARIVFDSAVTMLKNAGIDPHSKITAWTSEIPEIFNTRPDW